MGRLCADLLDRTLQVNVSLANYPGRISAPKNWDTGQVVLDEHMLYVIQRHTVRMDTAGSKRMLDPGTAVVIPPRTTFRMRWGDAQQPTMLRCRLSVARRTVAIAALSGVAIRTRAWDLEPVMLMLIEEAERPSPQQHDRVRALGLLMLSGVVHNGEERTVGLDMRLRRSIAQYVEQHLAHHVSPADLAAHVGLTLDYFTRRFRQTYGMAPRRWLVHERIRAACVLLAEGGASQDAVASALGYPDRKAFGRQFSQILRIPPGRWQQLDEDARS